MEAIIICGMPASGKTTVAEIISRRLNIPTIGVGDILKEMAVARGHIPGSRDWWDTQEGMKFVAERKTNPDFDKEADRRMIEIIAKGNVIITSYTAPWLSKKGFKVWLNCTAENRTERMAKRDHAAIAEMKKAVSVRDRENRKIYGSLYRIDFGNDLKPFNLVVETDNKNPEKIADEIIAAFNKKATEGKHINTLTE